MYLLGIDIGSSFVKASVIDAATGRCKAAASSPACEMTIRSDQGGWAEQDPDMWWKNAVQAIRQAYTVSSIPPMEIKAIGISYQMHGLVLIDRNNAVLRPSIIWCDSRAVETGKKAFKSIGKKRCLETMLNSPGNFTASKLKWVKDNEPDIFRQVNKFCLPGDYIALRLTGRITTTVSGLSEGILWDFIRHQPAHVLLDYYGISEAFLPEIVPTFGNQGGLTAQASKELGLAAGTPVTYRAGDQPNNAFSLNVLEPGEVAATAGTSGVMYGVTDTIKVDAASRVNTFAHVNHSQKTKRLGVLLCINGTGIANAWTRRLLGESVSYDAMNALAESVPIGCDGLVVLPFGNGAERMIENRDPGALVSGLRFNRHSKSHLCRAVQEGIAFALNYGIDIMRSIGVKATSIRAGRANMFLSKIFRDTVAGVIDAPIELYNTDGAQGAARGAGVGAGIYRDLKGAFAGLALEETAEPSTTNRQVYVSAYQQWRKALEQQLKQSN